MGLLGYLSQYMGFVVVVIVIINNPVCAVFVSRNSAKLENGPTYSREIKMKLDDTKKSFFYIIVTENVTSNNCMFVVSQSFVRAIQSSLLLLQHEYLLPGIFAANHNVTRSIATFGHRFRRRRISHTHTAVNIHIYDRHFNQSEGHFSCCFPQTGSWNHNWNTYKEIKIRWNGDIRCSDIVLVPWRTKKKDSPCRCKTNCTCR